MAKYYVVLEEERGEVGIYTTLSGVCSVVGVSDDTIRRWICRGGYYRKCGVSVYVTDKINRSLSRSIRGRKRFRG